MRNAAVAATALLAALSLTACQSADDDGKKPSASAPSTSAPAADKTGPTTDAKTPAADTSKRPTADTKPAPKGNGKTGGGTGGGGATGDGSPVTTACTDANTKVTVTKVSRPVNHLLLTVTNTGSKACNAYHAPLLRFDEAQAVTQIMDESTPQAVVTLAPRQSGYASILLSSGDGSGENGLTAKTLGVFFAPRSGEGAIGNAHALALPPNTYIDETAAVTYWQSSMSNALMY